MVVDTSVILAILFDEPRGPWCVEQLMLHAGQLRMSTVNLTESLLRIADRQPTLAEALSERLLSSEVMFVAPDVEQARIAATARAKFPLNLGDCFAYALAKSTGDGILTLDADFRAVDVPVTIPPAE